MQSVWEERHPTSGRQALQVAAENGHDLSEPVCFGIEYDPDDDKDVDAELRACWHCGAQLLAYLGGCVIAEQTADALAEPCSWRDRLATWTAGRAPESAP